MGLLPDTQNFGLLMPREPGNVFPATDFKESRKWAIPT